mgnify:CR=1 FL=1
MPKIKKYDLHRKNLADKIATPPPFFLIPIPCGWDLGVGKSTQCTESRNDSVGAIDSVQCADLSASESQIDDLIYKLYELDYAEIKNHKIKVTLLQNIQMIITAIAHKGAKCTGFAGQI